ncbi:hypothetical protein [Psychroflexus sp. ALD_RP9]|uniref:hypothetical protein n=1 Tax=Psychroflexus sp. ALD_RP9 TaxID=2777186 RepID=UPI001A903159|nr:hypothetical protein [Psychroflexus sp. ALD_RP9]QSS97819.1 hypothetical protein IMZ30_03650 [Psychroflexus sp. ALD_RP9]
MKSKYSEYFQNSFETQVKEHSTNFKDEILTQKSKNLGLNSKFNQLTNQYYKEVNSLKSKDDMTQKLCKVYDNRDKYDDQTEGLIFNIILLEEFDKLKVSGIPNPYKDYMHFLEFLAVIEALNFCKVKLRNHYIIIQNMFKIGRLDGYDNMPVFNLLKFIYPTDNKIASEVRKISYPETEVYNFNLKRKYIDLFLTDKFYYFITEEFIDQSTLTQHEFIRFFVYSEHVSKLVNFKCQTFELAYFFEILKEYFYDNLTYEEISKSGIFRTSNKTVVKSGTVRSNLHRLDRSKQDKKDKFLELKSFIL